MKVIRGVFNKVDQDVMCGKPCVAIIFKCGYTHYVVEHSGTYFSYYGSIGEISWIENATELVEPHPVESNRIKSDSMELMTSTPIQLPSLATVLGFEKMKSLNIEFAD